MCADDLGSPRFLSNSVLSLKQYDALQVECTTQYGSLQEPSSILFDAFMTQLLLQSSHKICGRLQKAFLRAPETELSNNSGLDNNAVFQQYVF